MNDWHTLSCIHILLETNLIPSSEQYIIPDRNAGEVRETFASIKVLVLFYMNRTLCRVSQTIARSMEAFCRASSNDKQTTDDFHWNNIVCAHASAERTKEHRRNYFLYFFDMVLQVYCVQ